MYNRHRFPDTGSIVLLYLLLLLTATGCRPDGAYTAGDCDSSIRKQYKALLEAAGNQAAAKAGAAMSFYERQAYPCRELIATNVILDLFDIIYTDHRPDTAVIPFLNRLADDPLLSATQRTEALLNIAGYYLYSLQDADRAIKYLRKAGLMWAGTNDTPQYKGYHAMMGEYMMQKSRLKEAAACYLHVIRLCELQQDSSGLAANLGNYASVYTAMKEHGKAVEIKRKAVAYFERTKQYQNMLIGYVSVGRSYVDLQQEDSGIACFRRALSLIEQGLVYSPHVAFNIHINLGAIAIGQKSYKRARQHYADARLLLDSLRDPHREQIYLMAATPAFADIRDVTKETDTIAKMMQAFYREEDLASVQDAAYAIFLANSIQKNFHGALDHLVVYDSVKNVLAQQENRNYITEMEARQESQKKELDIQLQQKELRRKGLFRWLLLALLTLASLTAGVVVARVRLGRRKKETSLHRQFTMKLLNNTEEERARVARDLHDGVSQELLLLKRQLKGENQHLSEKIDMILRDVRMISRELHPATLEKTGLSKSVAGLCGQLMDSGALFVTADISYGGGLEKSAELQLYRMIQETLHDARYAGAAAAQVTITETAGYVTTQIKNNGRHAAHPAAGRKNEPPNLLGLMGRSLALSGRAAVSDHAGATIVKIEIPKRK